MSYSVVLAQRAREDLHEILDYYNGQSLSAAQSFIRELIASIDSIAEYPKVGPVVFPRVRRKIVSRFPYQVFYTIKERKKEVVIARIWHQRRNPKGLNLK